MKYKNFGAWTATTRSVVIMTVLFAGFISIAGQTPQTKDVLFTFTLSEVDSQESKASFRYGDEIEIRANLDNRSEAPFPYSQSDDFYQFKFYLTRSDQALPVAYRADRAQILSLREEQESGGRRLSLDPILPGEVIKLGTWRLSDRYEDLTPGRYTLNIEYKTSKFEIVDGTGQHLRLEYEVSFEILP